jgi:hypothetical protein
MKPESHEVSGIRGIASRHGYRVETTPLALYNLKTDPGERATSPPPTPRSSPASSSTSPPLAPTSATPSRKRPAPTSVPPAMSARPPRRREAYRES